MSSSHCPPHQLTATLLLSLILIYIPNGVHGGRKVINYKPVEMSRSETISYFTSILQQKASSFDTLNEEVFSPESYAEDLYHRIDDLLPRPEFLRLLLRTKNITDKEEPRGESLLSSYLGGNNEACSRDSIWNHSISEILKKWDGDRSLIANDLEHYHKVNLRTPHEQMCNRFKGLTCQYKKAANPTNDHGLLQIPSDDPYCQCAGDSSNVGFYHKEERPGKKFPEGCYIRPWRPCHHLSVDNLFRQSYSEWHTNLASHRKQLVQMVFPVARVHRCAEGTYCTDLIPGMKTPVCWCTRDSINQQCKQNAANPEVQKRVPPLGEDLVRIRRDFVKMFINAKNLQATCNPEVNEKIEKLVNASGKDPTAAGMINLMKEVIQHTVRRTDPKLEATVRICDFRRGLHCDKVLAKCRGKETCDPGKIHLGKGVCVVNNAHACQTTEECVEHAKCRLVKGTTTTVCQCESGYGDRCSLHNPAFFARLFVPITSGFREDEYIQQQTRISKILEAWEDNMYRKYDQTCDPTLDEDSMNIVQYFGNLQEYDSSKGDALLSKAKQIDLNNPKLCMYTQFLRCSSRNAKCVPIYGKRIVSYSSPEGDNKWGSIHVEAEVDGVCGGVILPLIFRDLVAFHCPAGYMCRDSNQGYHACQLDCDSQFAPVGLCRKERTAVEGKEVKANKIGQTGGWNVISGRALANQDDTEMFKELIIQGRQEDLFTKSTTKPPLLGEPTTTPTVNLVNSTNSPMGDNCTETGNCTDVGGTSTITPEKCENCTTTMYPAVNNCTLDPYAENCKGNENETYVPPPTYPTKPPRKAAYEETCLYSDSQEGSAGADIGIICDSRNFLICQNSRCVCYPGLKWNWKELKCMIPVGSRCDEQALNLPGYMIYQLLLCENGACIPDNGREICRPESDDMLIIVEYRPTEI